MLKIEFVEQSVFICSGNVMSNVIRHVLIDLDGTLTDPKQGIQGSIRYALQHMQQPLLEDADLDWCIGPPLKQSLATLLQTQDNALAEQALGYYRERFSRIGLYENVVYSDVVATLQSMHARGYELFVATAKPTIYAKQILKHFHLDGFFCEIYGSELTGERTNKADLIAYILQQQPHLNPAACVMVGDREYDVLGARAHGIGCIAVQYGYGTVQELNRVKPDVQIAHFSELLFHLPALTETH